MTSLTDAENVIAALGRVESTRGKDGRVVALPQTTEDVAVVTRTANELGPAIEIAGAGTKRGWKNPVRADVVLSTARLDGVREHRWQDLTATVGAGTTWASMQRELAKHGQFVALDPLWPETATVGGIVASNDSGALRLKYGSLRDLIIGMTIVLADGTIAKSGGKVVKNVAGYDLHKLMTGAFGTLGVIAEVTFRLHPLPAHTALWSAGSRDPDVLRFLMIRVLDSHLSARAMQMRAGAEAYGLDIELASLPAVMAQQIEKLTVLARGCGGSCHVTQNAGGDLFHAREAMFVGAGVVVKLTMVPSAIANLSREVVKLGGDAVTQAVGIMLARFSDRSAPKALAELRELVKAQESASMTVLCGPETISRAAERVAPAGGSRAPVRSALSERIKGQFDPKGTLNPGRLVGGI